MFAKSIAAFTLANLAATAIAAPMSSPASQPIEIRHQADPAVTITFEDDTDNHWPITVPSSQTWTPTNVAESISHVHIENTGFVPCAFFGVDGTVIVSFPGDVKDLDVGPPQTIVGGICGPFKHE